MMLRMPHGLGDRYSPLYFLAALGAGGLVVTFFMWLLFWVPRSSQAVPVFEDIISALQNGGPALRAAIAVAAVGIAFFAIQHIRLLVWNISEFSAYRRSAAYRTLRDGNNETQLLALPLTSAMTINVGFILGLVFVPGLWSIVEFLFPFAMLAFLAIGVWALRLLGDFWGRVLTRGGFDCAANNNFAQLLPTFALAMVGVGLAAPAAMSATAWIAGLSFIASSFFIVLAIVLGAIKLVLGVRAMLENGASAESAPTLWIIVPILTVISIALMRQGHGLHEHFGQQGTPAETFTLLTDFFAVQLAFGLLGWVVLRKQGYFGRFVTGPDRSPGSYALVCPGVALSVMTQFFVNKGLVAVGLIAKFSFVFWLLSGMAIVLQAATIWLIFTLNSKHFASPTADTQATPAE